MSDLIDRQAAIDKFKPWLEVRSYGWGELNMLRAVINELENLPPVQPDHNAEVSKMEIIHCKDCLYKKICSWKNQGAKFCSFGERGNAE